MMDNETLAELSDPQVFLPQGPIRGKNLTSRGGKIIRAFQGIPYAKPPVGELRFKDPQEAPTWSGILNAQSEGASCMQIDFLTLEFKGVEDCLYLNVYTPKTKREGSGLSVMVWIHGGGFYSGSGNTDFYGPQYLLDHDVVLVTINYRVGAFGFLSLGTPEASGNYGLKDQVAALRWVQKNISKFGGNPKCVTIFGESAGGASIHYLMLSPLARGLFHRAIAQSGCAYNPWATNKRKLHNGMEAAKTLGCKATDPRSVLKYLRKIEAKELVYLDLKMRTETEKLFFNPTIEPAGTENAFLTEDPRSMLARGDIADVPLMTGCTTHEGIFLYSRLVKRKISIEDDLKQNLSWLIPIDFGLQENSTEQKEAWNEIDKFYNELTSGDIKEKYVLINTDSQFTVGVDELVREFAALHRQPVFYYLLSIDGDLSIFKKFLQVDHKGTCHFDDMSYLFQRLICPVDLQTASSKDIAAIDNITKLWTDFAKTGNPTPEPGAEVSWEAVEAPQGDSVNAVTHYFEIGERLQMKHEHMNKQRIDFWEQLYSKYRK